MPPEVGAGRFQGVADEDIGAPSLLARRGQYPVQPTNMPAHSADIAGQAARLDCNLAHLPVQARQLHCNPVHLHCNSDCLPAQADW